MADAVSRLSSGDDIGVFVMQHGARCGKRFWWCCASLQRIHSHPCDACRLSAKSRVTYYPNFNSVLNMQHVTKWAEPISMGKFLPDVMRRAFTQLRNGRAVRS